MELEQFALSVALMGTPFENHEDFFPYELARIQDHATGRQEVYNIYRDSQLSTTAHTVLCLNTDDYDSDSQEKRAGKRRDNCTIDESAVH